MRYPILLVADLHFTSNPRDEYRWGLWSWMRGQCKTRNINTIGFLGDLSDSKDFHPASLVNRIAREVKETSELARLYFIPGNHEWIKQGDEFWRFLPLMSDRIHYFTQPSDDPVPNKDGPVVRFLPFTKTPARDWAGHNFGDYDLVFMHQTVKGARASNGNEMDGEDVPVALLEKAGYVWSGDIHVPQQVTRRIEYVGSPYHVHFGDNFIPRCVLLTGPRDDVTELHYPTISRITLDCPDLEAVAIDAAKLNKGDQVKLRLRLAASEKHEWQRLRREALAVLRDRGAEVCGVELIVVAANGERLASQALRAGKGNSRPEDDVVRFVLAEELGPDALDTAMEVLEK